MRFIRSILVVFGVLLFLCGTAVMVGRAGSSVDLLPEIQHCGSMLCWFNIVPHKTSVTDATAWFKNSNQFTLSTQNYFPQHKNTYPSYAVQVGASRTTISSILLLDYDQTITAANIIYKFGAPCLVTFTTYMIYIDYPKMVIMFKPERIRRREPLRLDTPMDRILLHNGRLYQNGSCINPMLRPNAYLWRGFTLYEGS
jgi:hypothetical protein